MEKISIDDVVEFLNKMYELDRLAISDLVMHKALCGRKTAKLVGSDRIGIIGILNGLFQNKNESIIAQISIICPKGHKVPKGSTLKDKCYKCGNRFEFNGLKGFKKVQND